MFKLFTNPTPAPTVTSEAQIQLEVNQSVFATQPQPEPVGSVLPSAYACKSDYVRSMFAKSGYPMSAERAIVQWGFTDRGWGWVVTLSARYAYESDITLFFAEPENVFYFASLRTAPQVNPIAEPEVNPSPIAKSDIASLYGEPVCFGDNPITEPVNLDQLPFDFNATYPIAPQPEPRPIAWGLVREVNTTLEYWQSELDNALGENNPSRVNLCNQWIKSLSNVLMYIVFTL